MIQYIQKQTRIYIAKRKLVKLIKYHRELNSMINILGIKGELNSRVTAWVRAEIALVAKRIETIECETYYLNW